MRTAFTICRDLRCTLLLGSREKTACRLSVVEMGNIASLFLGVGTAFSAGIRVFGACEIFWIFNRSFRFQPNKDATLGCGISESQRAYTDSCA